VGVAVVTAVGVAKGVPLPEGHPETLTDAVELLEPETEPLPVILPVVDPEGDPVTE
jgi:hypothetical protein